MSHLIVHTKERGAAATPNGPLLRYRSGQRITRRRYDYIWTRLGKHLPWVAAQDVSTHWLRHTTLTWVERNFGYAVARAYAATTTAATAPEPPRPTFGPMSTRSPQPSPR
jgi:integrase/recombinase XerC